MQRGFYCDDTSVQYPYKSDTIPMWLLGVYGGVGPVLIFCIVEIWVVRPFHCGRRPSKSSLKRRQVDYLKTIIQSAFLFALGIAICFLITEVGKRKLKNKFLKKPNTKFVLIGTIGRLRPYYVTICNPVWSELVCTKTVVTASGPIVIPQYIINHRCSSSATETELKEARLSFPSGHSSYSTFAFVFLFVSLIIKKYCITFVFFCFRFILKHVLFAQMFNFSNHFFNVYVLQLPFLLVYHVLLIINIIQQMLLVEL